MSQQQVDSDFLEGTERLTATSSIGSDTYVSFTENRLRVPKPQEPGKRRSAIYHDDFTRPLILAAFVACLGSFQFGYHTGELNTPKAVFTGCQGNDPLGHGIFSFLPACVALSEFEFSVATGMFPLGGIGGSVLGGILMDSIGRRKSIIWTNVLLAIGSLVMVLSSEFMSLIVGRLLVGIAGGMSLVVVPAYIAEVTSLELRGFFGICNQFSIVSGIVVSQTIGLAYSDVSTWRYILSGGMIASLVQALGLPFLTESPWFILDKYDDYIKTEEILQYLRCRVSVESEITERTCETSYESPEYGAINYPQESQQQQRPLTFLKFIKSSRYRVGLAMVVFLHLTQQMSGINAIMYYSTTILTSTFGDKAKFVTVLVNVFQLLFTYVASRVVERWGRRSLMLISSTAMSFFSIILAFSLNRGYTALSAASLFLSVGSFALGLGPLPFMLASELFDSQSVGYASTLGLVTNLTFNFVVASTFLPISDLFPADQPGSVFLIFAAWLLGSAALFYRILPETRAATAQTNMAQLKRNVRNFF